MHLFCINYKLLFALFDSCNGIRVNQVIVILKPQLLCGVDQCLNNLVNF